MTDRYVVMSSDDARRANLPGAPEEPRSGWDADYDVLVDTARNVIVYYDFCVANAPEEMYLYRRLSTFVDELNRLASEAASTAAEEPTDA